MSESNPSKQAEETKLFGRLLTRVKDRGHTAAAPLLKDEQVTWLHIKSFRFSKRLLLQPQVKQPLHRSEMSGLFLHLLCDSFPFPGHG